jgi:putative FmdB family regulatory protein
MPLYEYKCEKCEKVTERLISNISYRPPTTECKHCKDEAKLISSVPSDPQFKGKGFYKTDY